MHDHQPHDTFVGTIEIRPWAVGTRAGITNQTFLDINENVSYRVRLAGSSMFQSDSDLSNLRGRKVEVTGVLHSDMILAATVRPIDVNDWTD